MLDARIISLIVSLLCTTLTAGYSSETRISFRIQTLFSYPIKGGTDVLQTEYTFTGKPLRTLASHSSSSVSDLQELTEYTYDHAERLVSVDHTIGSGSKRRLQQNTYDSFGWLSSCQKFGKPALKTTYDNNIQYALKSLSTGSLFGETLYYQESFGGNTPKYNGGISAMSWSTDGSSNQWGYRFPYDLKSRLTSAQYLTNGNRTTHYDASYSYDSMGNITSLMRNGRQDGGTYGKVNQLTYGYDGNRLVSVSDAVASPTYNGFFGFFDGADQAVEYSYNANGAMTMDLNRGISSIDYDLLGNIRKITLSGGTVDYVYSADGTRLRTVRSIRRGYTVLKDSTDYCGNLILKNGAPYMYRFPGGYISFSDGVPSGCHYYIEDYLGNVRMVVDSNNKKEQITHYYPYGGVIGGIALNAQLQPYKFGGNEFERTCGLDWYDIHARQYDPIVPSWNKIDPLAEEYYHMSPYIYCGGDPVNAIDADGEKVYIIATTLPGAQYIPFATHTYTLVTGHGNPLRYAYGSDKDGISGLFSGNLERCYYVDDNNTMNAALDYIKKNNYNEKFPDNIKNIIEIDPPAGMSCNEFDFKVINVAKQFDDNKEIQYNVLTNSNKTGNCNTSTTTLLIKSGVPKEKIDEIGKQLNGIVGGWGEIRPWTEEERKTAINEH